MKRKSHYRETDLRAFLGRACLQRAADKRFEEERLSSFFRVPEAKFCVATETEETCSRGENWLSLRTGSEAQWYLDPLDEDSGKYIFLDYKINVNFSLSVYTSDYHFHSSSIYFIYILEAKELINSRKYVCQFLLFSTIREPLIASEINKGNNVRTDNTFS